jgi:hypothetical protein
MAGIDDATAICRVGWRDNRDGLDVALAVNRLLSAGARAWWLMTAHEAADAGDYLVEVTSRQQRALASLGVASSAWRGDIPGDARALSAPAACLFAGTASKFPYFAYYALALLRLGIDYVPCDGPALASGMLDEANVLILPGGFATWGVDAAENAPGADARIRDFLESGGTAIGSCGGAFYLSAGRPGWTGTAQAKPLYTHEYLQSGVGIVTLQMRPGPLALGCPPTVEVPYYHGPIYDLVGAGVEVAATFHSLSLPGRLAIDNPLDEARFRRDMAGKPAILLASGDRAGRNQAAHDGASGGRTSHRAVLFSPHPEMGDLIRKYIALDGYVRHYLPIRGFGTLRDTLRHYRVNDAPSFRLVSNAVHDLMSDARCSTAARPPVATCVAETDLVTLCEHASMRLPPFDEGDEGDLLRDVAAGIRARMAAVSARAVAAAMTVKSNARLWQPYRHLVETITQHAQTPAASSPGQALMEFDLDVALLECWTRVAEFDRALAGQG